MRISTALIFQSGANAMGRQQTSLLHTQQQLATGRRMLTPSDDPVAASDALRVQQGRVLTQEDQASQTAAKNKLALLESRIGDAGDLYQNVRQLTVQAGNAALSSQDRASIAKEIRGLKDQLLSIANSRDGVEGYLFGGYAQDAAPFAQGAAGVVYNGDQGQRLLQVASGRQMAVTESGAALFDRVRNGNGTVVTAVGAANTGTAVVGAPGIADATLLTHHSYQLSFGVAAGVTTYQVQDVTTGTMVSVGNPYTPGGAISFDGITFKVDGAPANGDTIAIGASANQSVFDTLDSLAAALEAPAATTQDRTRLSNALNTALNDMDQAMDTARSVRTGVGARMRELDALDAASSADLLDADTRLSALQDLDYADAVSRLTLQTTALQAAQQAYIRTTGLSLFNFMT